MRGEIYREYEEGLFISVNLCARTWMKQSSEQNNTRPVFPRRSSFTVTSPDARMITTDIRWFNATGSGRTDDTEAFESAIRSIEERGGGRLLLLAGHYRLRPINLTSNLIFYLEKGARLTAISKGWPLIPPLPSYGRGRDHPGPRHSSLLHGEHLENVTIVGQGESSIIDGNGWIWWKRRLNGDETITRGHLIEFLYSRKVSIYNITLKNSPFWTNHFFDCDDVHVKNVRVQNPEGSPNTDGWDPDSSRNVLIEDSSYVGDDDCVAIKSGWDCFGIDYGKPSVNITIRNLTCHGVFAGIAIGSEMSGGVQDVTVENVRFTRANKPVNVKVGNTRGGYVNNITYRNLLIDGVIDQAVHIDAFHFYNAPNPECPTGWKPPSAANVSNISIMSVDGWNATIQGKEVFHFAGLSESPLDHIYMQDVFFPKPSNAVAWNCSNVMKSIVKKRSVFPWPPCSNFDIIDARSRTNELADHIQLAINLRISVVMLVLIVSFTWKGTALKKIVSWNGRET